MVGVLGHKPVTAEVQVQFQIIPFRVVEFNKLKRVYVYIYIYVCVCFHVL